MGDDKLIFGHHRSLSNGINGWAELFFDRQAGLPKLRMIDLSIFGSFGGHNRDLPKRSYSGRCWIA